MKHELNELYRIKGETGKLYTAEAVKNLVHAPRYKAQKGECFAEHAMNNGGAPIKIYDKLNTKEYRLGYLYGEKTWYDTAEEVEARRYYEAHEGAIIRLEKQIADTEAKLAEMRAKLEKVKAETQK